MNDINWLSVIAVLILGVTLGIILGRLVFGPWLVRRERQEQSRAQAQRYVPPHVAEAHRRRMMGAD